MFSIISRRLYASTTEVPATKAAPTVFQPISLKSAVVKKIPPKIKKFRKPNVHVYLLETVQKLGIKGDIVFVPTEDARKRLIPFKLAYYVPKNWKGEAILPDNWVDKQLDDDLDLEQILPAFVEEGYTEDHYATDAEAGKGDMLHASNADLVEIRSLENNKRFEQLNSITYDNGVPLLVFTRDKINATRIFGSVTIDDIIAEIKKNLNVIVERNECRVVGNDTGKIKDVGRHLLEINIQGAKEILKFEIEIK